jgi:O-antigen/teichoic acid export membrane protein
MSIESLSTKLLSERLLRLSKEALWIATGQVMAILGTLVGVRLLTGMLDPSMYGELALGMSVATGVNQAVLGPLGNAATRFYAPAHEKGDVRGYLLAVRKLVVRSTLAIGAMVPPMLVGILLARHGRWSAVFVAAAAFSVVSGYNAILGGIQNAARQRAIVALHQGAESWARYLVAAAAILALGTSSAAAMSGYVLAATLVLASQWYFFQRIVSEARTASSEPDWGLRIWTFMWPNSIWGVFTFVQQISDRWALAIFSSTHDVGMFAALFQLGYYPISLLTGIAVQFLQPIFFKRAGDARDERRNADVSVLSTRLSSLAFAVTLVAFVVAMQCHELLFRVLVAREYGSVSYLLPWVVLAGGMFAAGQIMSLNLMSQMRTRALMVAKIVTAVAGCVFSFVGAYRYGVVGVVAASCAFSGVFFAWMYALAKLRKA